MSTNVLAILSVDQLSHVAGGATPMTNDEKTQRAQAQALFRREVLIPCAAMAGAQAVLAHQTGKPFDVDELTDACAAGVKIRSDFVSTYKR